MATQAFPRPGSREKGLQTQAPESLWDARRRAPVQGAPPQGVLVWTQVRQGGGKGAGDRGEQRGG